MTSAPAPDIRPLRFLLRLGYWMALVGGLLLPWLIMIGFDHLVRHVPWGRPGMPSACICSRRATTSFLSASSIWRRFSYGPSGCCSTSAMLHWPIR